MRRARRDREARPLLDSLDDPHVRPLAAKYLGELGYWRAASKLRRLLGAGDDWTRVESVRALGRMREADPFEDIVNMLSDDSDLVRSWVLGALAELNDPRGLPVLAESLEDESWMIRRSAIKSLRMTGNAAAIAPLENRLRREPWWRRRVYRKAIAALERETAQPASGGI